MALSERAGCTASRSDRPSCPGSGIVSRAWFRTAPLRWTVAAVLMLTAAGCADDASQDAPSATAAAAAPSVTAPPATVSSPVVTVTAVAAVTAGTVTTEPSREWRLLAGGDVLMDRSEPQGIDPFANVVPSLASADFAIVNVEMAISDRGAPVDKLFTFRAPPSAAQTMAAGGVNVANLANNHAKDYGSQALMDTVDALEAAGVVAVGAGRNAELAYRHRILPTDAGVKIAFVGTSMVMPLGFGAGSQTPGISSSRQTQRVYDSVRMAASIADAVVVAVHWGIERDTCPNTAQRDFARGLLEAGADAVIGHHPHVLQPVEFVDGRLVAYSLGNFVWRSNPGHTGETGVLQIDFDGGEIIGWTFHPHLLDIAGAPVPADSGRRHDRIRDIISGNCAAHDPPPPSYATTTTVPETPPATTGDPASSTTTGEPES